MALKGTRSACKGAAPAVRSLLHAGRGGKLQKAHPDPPIASIHSRGILGRLAHELIQDRLQLTVNLLQPRREATSKATRELGGGQQAV